ncbi:MAG: serine/threonine protein kinase [Holophagales bacterium]|nr:serine/threonine protein kinase [Holophagales bacterium]
MGLFGGAVDDRTRTMDEGSRGVSRDEPGGIRLFAAGAAVGSRFEIRSVRGTGGSAVVYSAFDRDLKQIVALKVLRADRTSPAALARLRREVAIARQAASPRLVRVYDIDASGESVFLTMEDIEGGSLRDRLAAGALPLEETLRIAGEILEGLAVLHGLGIVHRDVKPGNVLLAADGSVKLADFGLAHRFEADETRATATDAIVGTVEYLSPEQALGGDLDGRSDLYSFGITLWEMLTGGVPFRRDSAVGTALAHVREPAPPLRSVRPEAPAWLAAYVARLLSKTPGERYPAAEAALADLRARRATANAARRGRRGPRGHVGPGRRGSRRRSPSRAAISDSSRSRPVRSARGRPRGRRPRRERTRALESDRPCEHRRPGELPSAGREAGRRRHRRRPPRRTDEGGEDRVPRPRFRSGPWGDSRRAPRRVGLLGPSERVDVRQRRCGRRGRPRRRRVRPLARSSRELPLGGPAGRSGGGSLASPPLLQRAPGLHGVRRSRRGRRKGARLRLRGQQAGPVHRGRGDSPGRSPGSDEIRVVPEPHGGGLSRSSVLRGPARLPRLVRARPGIPLECRQADGYRQAEPGPPLHGPFGRAVRARLRRVPFREPIGPRLGRSTGASNGGLVSPAPGCPPRRGGQPGGGRLEGGTGCRDDRSGGRPVGPRVGPALGGAAPDRRRGGGRG